MVKNIQIGFRDYSEVKYELKSNKVYFNTKFIDDVVVGLTILLILL